MTVSGMLLRLFAYNSNYEKNRPLRPACPADRPDGRATGHNIGIIIIADVLLKRDYHPLRKNINYCNN